MRLGKYLKKAFLNHWNLLLFLGGMGFALLSRRPDVYVPLVLAGEAAYLGAVGGHPRFQRRVDMEESRANRQREAIEAIERILRTLPPAKVRRFEELRERCLALRQIARQLTGPDDSSRRFEPDALDELHLSGLDRLLWIHLRLLYTQHMLDRFFERTSEKQIQDEIRRLEDRIRQLSRTPEANSPYRQGVLKAVEDNLATCQARLDNYRKARENSELVQAEIERLESKIRSITELAINRQDPQFVSGEVDSVAQSLVRTERTMNELQFATGLAPVDDLVPSILPRGLDPAEPLPADLPDPWNRGRRQQDMELH